MGKVSEVPTNCPSMLSDSEAPSTWTTKRLEFAVPIGKSYSGEASNSLRLFQAMAQSTLTLGSDTSAATAPSRQE